MSVDLIGALIYLAKEDLRRFSSVYLMMASIYSSNNRICAFCDNKISQVSNKSICDNCSYKYKIRSYDLADDGCGCDDG
jgi:hypothetical protein